MMVVMIMLSSLGWFEDSASMQVNILVQNLHDNEYIIYIYI